MMAFTGGEPLVRQDLFELLAYSQALGFTNTLATNATLIDDDVARRLRRFGVVIAAVSLDGFTAEQHDMVRGIAGSFRLPWKECVRYGVPASCCTSTLPRWSTTSSSWWT